MKEASEVEANTVGEALGAMTTSHPGLRDHLYVDQKRLRSFVNVYVNDADIRYASQLDTVLEDGDIVTIVPAIAGGAKAPFGVERPGHQTRLMLSAVESGGIDQPDAKWYLVSN